MSNHTRATEPPSRTASTGEPRKYHWQDPFVLAAGCLPMHMVCSVAGHYAGELAMYFSLLVILTGFVSLPATLVGIFIRGRGLIPYSVTIGLWLLITQPLLFSSFHSLQDRLVIELATILSILFTLGAVVAVRIAVLHLDD